MIFDKYPEIIFTSSKIADGNMSTLKGDPHIAIKNRKKFLKKYQLKLENTVNMFLEHHSKVAIVGKNELGKGAFEKNDGIAVDGIITDQKGIALMVMTGDCLPIAIFDPTKGIIALIHGSKKSLELGVLENSISLLHNKFVVLPSNLRVTIGPSIGPCCYHTNLWLYTQKKLQKLGILKKNIYNRCICTYHTKEYFSHRRSDDTQTPEGRFITILGIKNVN